MRVSRLLIADTTLSGGVSHNIAMTQPNNYPHLVTWFEIPAADLDRAAKFYSEVLGVPMKVEQLGPERLSVFPHEKPSVGGCVSAGGQPSAAGVVLYLNASPSLDAALNRVPAAGGEIVTPKTALPAGMGFYAKIRDTEGNVVGLHALA
jgi:predicted enzyme related to lactoylglutathione lyase